jgi:very-short-patch-repair endonuclease
VGGRTVEYERKVGPHSADREVAELARRQHGVASAAQLRAAGLTEAAIRRRTASGRLHRIHRGVYAVGHSALTRRARQLAGVFACGPGAVLSHRSAGDLWAIARAGPAIEITAPRSRGSRPEITVHRSRRLDRADRSVIDAIPVTSLARTIVDLADVLDERRLGDAVQQAEVRRLFDLGAVYEALERVPGRAGRHRLLRLLSSYAEPPFTRSEAERNFLRLCERHGLPKPSVNLCVHGFEVDFLWQEAGLAVEFDGAATHLTRRAFHEDRRRDRALAAGGVQVVRVTWRDLVRWPAGLARELDAVRSQRLAALR